METVARKAAEVRLIELPGHPEYWAGDDGRIYSTRLSKVAIPLASGEDKDGYPTVQLTVAPRKSRRLRVHQLIAAAYELKRPEDADQLRHLNGKHKDNRPDNLAWGTAQDNADDRARHGRTVRGSKSHLAKLTEEDVVNIRAELKTGRTQTSIAGERGLAISTINHIVTGRNWGGL